MARFVVARNGQAVVKWVPHRLITQDLSTTGSYTFVDREYLLDLGAAGGSLTAKFIMRALTHIDMQTNDELWFAFEEASSLEERAFGPLGSTTQAINALNPPTPAVLEVALSATKRYVRHKIWQKDASAGGSPKAILAYEVQALFTTVG